MGVAPLPYTEDSILQDTSSGSFQSYQPLFHNVPPEGSVVDALTGAGHPTVNEFQQLWLSVAVSICKKKLHC